LDAMGREGAREVSRPLRAGDPRAKKGKGPGALVCPAGCAPECDLEGDEAGRGRTGSPQGLCLEAKRTERRVVYKHVGQGKGAYERVDRFNYVGSESGDHRMEEPSGCCSACLIALCCLGCIGLAGLAAYTALSASKVIPGLPDLPWTKEAEELIFHTAQTADYNCTDGLKAWEETWTLAKKDFCCRSIGEGCPPDNHYDCKVDAENWHTHWSPGKKNFCCGYDHSGCEAPEEKQMVSGPKTDYDCEKDLEDWQTKWTEGKMDFCCERYKFGCRQKPSPVPFNCEVGLANWDVSWNSEKQAWCCKHEKVGCTSAATEKPAAIPAKGCDEMCTLKGATHSCKARVQWLVQQPAPTGFQGNRHACAYSLALVLRDCPVCAMCSLAGADCQAPGAAPDEYDCDKDADRWANVWPRPQQDWCCKHHNVGCMSHVPEPYACVGDYKHWPEPESIWCCDNLQLGCNA